MQIKSCYNFNVLDANHKEQQPKQKKEEVDLFVFC